MLMVVHIFIVNSFDFEVMKCGLHLLLSGVSPWSSDVCIEHFYNPPFAILFMWPILFTTPKTYLILGGASLFAFIFYHKTWVALAWFATNSFLWIIAAGGIDMFVVGIGLFLLAIGDKSYNKLQGLCWRVFAYGLLMVKPQGTIFIVILYILVHKDWKGFLVSIILYGLLFLPLYPDWINAILYNPPLSQTQATHTIWARYGVMIAGLIAILIILTRRWKYWQLGGALAGIITPYGMPGLPSLLILTGVDQMKAIPIVLIYSGLLSLLTWINPPLGVEYYAHISPLMTIYHLSILGLALALACMSKTVYEHNDIAVMDWIKSYLSVQKPKMGN